MRVERCSTLFFALIGLRGVSVSRVNMNLKKRCISAIAIILILGFGIDICRLFWFQVIKTEEYKTAAEAQQLSDTVISADRGVIYDANMNVLAESASAWLVYVNPSKIKDEMEKNLVATGLAGIFTDLKVENIKEKISNSDYSYVKIKSRVK